MKVFISLALTIATILGFLFLVSAAFYGALNAVLGLIAGEFDAALIQAGWALFWAIATWGWSFVSIFTLATAKVLAEG